MLIDQSIARIRAYRLAMKWSVNRFASEAGVGESTIRNMDAPDWSPTTVILRKLEAAIPADFFTDKPSIESSTGGRAA